MHYGIPAFICVCFLNFFPCLSALSSLSSTLSLSRQVIKAIWLHKFLTYLSSGISLYLFHSHIRILYIPSHRDSRFLSLYIYYFSFMNKNLILNRYHIIFGHSLYLSVSYWSSNQFSCSAGKLVSLISHAHLR
jgi:hypothetical protein